MDVIYLQPRTYVAKSQTVSVPSVEFKMSGTLDGFIDLAVTQNDGSHLTYPLTCDEALELSEALCATVKDVKHNCLYDKDALLDK
jgi:hypothetical protein